MLYFHLFTKKRYSISVKCHLLIHCVFCQENWLKIKQDLVLYLQIKVTDRQTKATLTGKSFNKSSPKYLCFPLIIDEVFVQAEGWLTAAEAGIESEIFSQKKSIFVRDKAKTSDTCSLSVCELYLMTLIKNKSTQKNLCKVSQPVLNKLLYCQMLMVLDDL